MNNNHLNAAIQLLITVTQDLQTLAATTSPTDLAMRPTVEAAMATLKQTMAELSAAINPPRITHIPPEFLAKAESLGIPLDDLEVRVAIASHHPSQFAGVLAEIQNRSTEIRRRREYFLIRLPEMPIEQLGARLPVVTAADFEGPTEPVPREIRDAIKAKYHLDKLIQTHQISRASLYDKIKAAYQFLETNQSPDPVSEEDEEVPF